MLGGTSGCRSVLAFEPLGCGEELVLLYGEHEVLMLQFRFQSYRGVSFARRARAKIPNSSFTC